MRREHNDPERFADWPPRLSQRGIGQVEGIWALARSKSPTNLQSRFCVAFRTDWYGSIADQFLPVAQHVNEDGWSRRLTACIVSRHRCSRGRSVGLHCFRHRCGYGEPSWWSCLGLPSNLQRCCLGLEEPLEDLLFPNVGSTSDVSSDMAFCFNERIVASASGSKMVRVTACGMKVAIPSGQSDRVPVLAPGSSVPVDPTADLAHGSEVSVIVGEGAFRRLSGHGPDRVCESSLRTCQYASSPSRQEGARCTTSEIREMQSYDREFALGIRRDTSRRVIRDQSVAEETISAPGVRSQARRTNYKAVEG